MAGVTNLRSPAEAGLSKLFESARQSFASETAIAREEAFRFFEATGLPSRREIGHLRTRRRIWAYAAPASPRHTEA